LNFLRLLILLIVYMLLNSIILLKQLNNKLSILLSFDFKLISLSLNLNNAVPLSIKSILHLLHSPL
jgi:hypothetical protein